MTTAHAIYQQLWRILNFDYPKKWRLAHLKSTRESAKKCYYKNREARLQYRKKYCQLNPNARRMWGKSARGRILCRANEGRRRTRLRAGKIGNALLIAKVYERAAELRQWFNVVVDHIIPIAKGGAHTPGNLQIIYAFENAKKNASLNYKPKIIFT